MRIRFATVYSVVYRAFAGSFIKIVYTLEKWDIYSAGPVVSNVLGKNPAKNYLLFSHWTHFIKLNPVQIMGRVTLGGPQN
jgi:hypothetical protein